MSESSDVPLISNSHRSQRAWSGEPLVLIPAICLMFLCGATTTIENPKLKYIDEPEALSLLELCNAVLIIPALLLSVLLTRYTGLKPVIFSLFLLYILTSILHSISVQGTWLLVVFIAQGILKGGSFISFIAILEYSSSKSRLKYLLANVAVWQAKEYFTKTALYRGGVLGNEYSYLQVILIVLGLVCLGLTLQWPESPRWLASRGKTEDSRKAFLWLHGDEGEEELQGLLREPQNPGPPMLFNLSILLTILTISFHKFTIWYRSYRKVYPSPDFISKEFKTALVFCSALFGVCCTAVFMNNIKRKIIMFIILGLTVVFYVFRYLGGLIAAESNPTVIHVLNRLSDQITTSGPLVQFLTIVVSNVPREYRSFAYALLSYMYLGLSAIILLIAIMISNT